MKIIPTSVRQAWIRFCRRHFAEAVIHAPQPQAKMEEAVSLHMVVSAHTWKMGLMALRSLEFQSGMRWQPFIHEDGSLDDAAAAEMQAWQPDARIIRRREADEAVSRFLAPWPSCQGNRDRHNWFLKFFDTYFFAPHERYIVLDSDIIFFRSPREILDWITTQAETLHVMEDTREAYASPREELEAVMGFPFWKMVNSGICLMHKRAVDLDLCEKFMAHFSVAPQKFMFLEQSLFALTASAWNQGGPLPKKYEISWGNFRDRKSVCRHYVGPFKDDALYVEGASTFWMDLKLGRRRA